MHTYTSSYSVCLILCFLILRYCVNLAQDALNLLYALLALSVSILLLRFSQDDNIVMCYWCINACVCVRLHTEVLEVPEVLMANKAQGKQYNYDVCNLLHYQYPVALHQIPIDSPY